MAATDPAPIDAATTDRARARSAASGLATRTAACALLAAGLALAGCGDADRDAGAADSRGDAGTERSDGAAADPARGTSDGAPDDAPRAMSARELIDATDAVEKLLNAERTDEAVIVARRLLERAPAGSGAAATAGEIAARALFTHAQMQAAALAPPERAALLAEAADCAERSVADGQADAGKIAFAALLSSNAGRADRARQLFDRALELAPTDAQTLLQAALSSLAQGDLARTRDLIARRRAAGAGGGAGAGSDDGWNDGLEAEAALSAGDPSAAVAAAQRAVAANRDALEFRLILARALRRAGRAGDAARLLSALEAEARAKPAIAEQFALALGESGDLAGAARAWDAALRANPADPFVRAEAALAFHRAGDTARAAAELAVLDAMKGGAAQRRRVAELMRPAG